VVFGVPGETPEAFRLLIDAAPALRWVQGTSAGAGQSLAAADLGPDVLERVVFTKANGVHAVPLAEFSLFGLLAMARDLPRLQTDRAARRWDHWPTVELRGRTVLVVGLGEIGLEVARLASAVGMRVLGVKRNPSGDYPDVERVAGTDALVELAAESDAMVVTLPLTDATRDLVDARALRALRPGATFVNVGRGGVVDEDELVAALRDGHLRGAVLDVTRVEPLPDDSPLWTLPNVVLSPHTAALVPQENERIVRQFTANLRRFLDGETLSNRIDTTSFY
jgi:phosphoglycerate dehydrogenase-like enzyme